MLKDTLTGPGFFYDRTQATILTRFLDTWISNCSRTCRFYVGGIFKCVSVGPGEGLAVRFFSFAYVSCID